jgi:hypothetical protein
MLRLPKGNAVPFTPLHSDLSKFDLFEPTPGVPQVVFSKQMFEQAEGARATNGRVEIVPQPSHFSLHPAKSLLPPPLWKLRSNPLP